MDNTERGGSYKDRKAGRAELPRTIQNAAEAIKVESPYEERPQDNTEYGKSYKDRGAGRPDDGSRPGRYRMWQKLRRSSS